MFSLSLVAWVVNPGNQPRQTKQPLLTWWKVLVAAHNMCLEPHCENIKPGVSMEWESPVSQKDKAGQKWGEECSWQFQKSPAGRWCLRLSMNQNLLEDLWKHQPIPSWTLSLEFPNQWTWNEAGGFGFLVSPQVMLGSRDSSLGACGLDLPLTCFVLCVLGWHWYVGQRWIRMLMPSALCYSCNPPSNPVS